MPFALLKNLKSPSWCNWQFAAGFIATYLYIQLILILFMFFLYATDAVETFLSFLADPSPVIMRYVFFSTVPFGAILYLLTRKKAKDFANGLIAGWIITMLYFGSTYLLK